MPLVASRNSPARLVLALVTIAAAVTVCSPHAVGLTDDDLQSLPADVQAHIDGLTEENARLRSALGSVATLAASALGGSPTESTSESCSCARGVTVDATAAATSGVGHPGVDFTPPPAVASTGTTACDQHGVVYVPDDAQSWVPVRYPVSLAGMAGGPERVYYMPHALSWEDCDYLINYGSSRWKESEIFNEATPGSPRHQQQIHPQVAVVHHDAGRRA